MFHWLGRRPKETTSWLWTVADSEVLSEGGRRGAQVPIRNLPVGQIDVAPTRGSRTVAAAV